jgi:hypothetical protein
MAPKDWGVHNSSYVIPSPLPLHKVYRGEYYIPISFPKNISTVQWRTAPNWRYEV